MPLCARGGSRALASLCQTVELTALAHSKAGQSEIPETVQSRMFTFNGSSWLDHILASPSLMTAAQTPPETGTQRVHVDARGWRPLLTRVYVRLDHCPIAADFDVTRIRPGGAPRVVAKEKLRIRRLAIQDVHEAASAAAESVAEHFVALVSYAAACPDDATAQSAVAERQDRLLQEDLRAFVLKEHEIPPMDEIPRQTAMLEAMAGDRVWPGCVSAGHAA